MVEVPASLVRLITINRGFAILMCSSARYKHALTVEA